MLQDPREFLWHVVTDSGTHVASCAHAEDAAACVGIYGGGCRVLAGALPGSRWVRREGASTELTLVWSEKEDGDVLDRGYDEAAEVMRNRLDKAAGRVRHRWIPVIARAPDDEDGQ